MTGFNHFCLKRSIRSCLNALLVRWIMDSHQAQAQHILIFIHRDSYSLYTGLSWSYHLQIVPLHVSASFWKDVFVLEFSSCLTFWVLSLRYLIPFLFQGFLYCLHQCLTADIAPLPIRDFTYVCNNKFVEPQRTYMSESTWNCLSET